MTLVSSDVLDYEIARNPNLTRLEFAQETLSSARTFVRLTDAIETRSIRLLVQELGAADAARFIGQFTTGYGDYTAERGELFKDVRLDDVVEEIRSRKSRSGDDQQ